MDKKLYKFGMDWLNGVLPVSDVMSVFEMLEKFSSKLRFDRWTLLNSGRYNYSRRYCLDGKMTVQLMYNPVSDEEGFTADMNHNNSGIFFSISGDGIRYLHSLGGDVSALNKLLFYFYRNSFKSSRFDVYCDILDDKNEIVPLIQEAFDYVGCEQVGKPLIRTRLRKTSKTINDNFKKIPMYDEHFNEFYNCQLGHHGSSVGMFRCYNKKVEVMTGRLARMDQDKPIKNALKQEAYELNFAKQLFSEYGVKDYWYRLEYEMHKDNAASCFDTLMSSAEADNSPLCFEGIFYSVFDRVFSIIVPQTCNQMATNTYDRVPISEVWASFGSELQENSIHLVQFKSVPYIKCTLSRIGKNANRICGYYYAIGEYLRTLSYDERRDFLQLAKEKFENQPKYNLLRDEIEEFHLNNSALRSEIKNNVFSQIEIDFPAFA